VEASVKLVPKFSEKDVEIFLISFEKVAELNNFPPDKYAAILQAQLTGKALKVFTELSVEECRDFPHSKSCFATGVFGCSRSLSETLLEPQ